MKHSILEGKFTNKEELEKFFKKFDPEEKVINVIRFIGLICKGRKKGIRK